MVQHRVDAAGGGRVVAGEFQQQRATEGAAGQRVAQFGMAGGSERLRIATADVSLDEKVLMETLRRLVMPPKIVALLPSAMAAG